MQLAIGADHAGFRLKEDLKKELSGISFVDVGTHSEDPVDYPDIADKLCTLLVKEHIQGILICSTGIGMCMAANRNPKIRAALGYSTEAARLSRLHNNANVLCLASRTMKAEDAIEIAKAWLDTRFSGEERHVRRLSKF
ncbi:MAG: RpiB/LacA/LacB family sugar-phosphate isomerase [Nanoarchaeota archaeon]